MYVQQFNALQTVSNIILSFFMFAGYCLPSTQLIAAELIDLTLTHNQGVYQLKLEIILDASPEYIHEVVTDYVHIYRVNPSIIDSEILHTPDNSVVRVRTLINDCIMIFCKVINRVEEVSVHDTGNISAVVIPELSNIKSGVTIWQIQSMGGRTRINYLSSIEPGFFIPPLIGTHFVKQKLKKEALLSLDNIERIAQIQGSKNALAQ
jgi:hypothetical protein